MDADELPTRVDAIAGNLGAGGPDLPRRFSGIARLYGEHGAVRFAQARVVVAGMGGVGSWTAEALARSGVGAITLVDLDHVAESNTNRQVHALGDTYGRAKVAVMAERITAINPACVVQPLEDFVTPANAGQIVAGADIVIDCIDEVVAKVALVLAARAARVPLIVCGAAGGRVDPTRIRCDDLALAAGDPLLASVRQRLRRRHGFPLHTARRRRFGVLGVYSDEPLIRSKEVACAAGAPLGCAGYGSSVAVTAAMGFVAAARALQHLSESVTAARCPRPRGHAPA